MKRKVVIPVIFLFFMSSCAEISFNVWKDDNYQGGPFKKVFVVVALADPPIKNRFESEFAKQLEIHWTDGEISSDFFPGYSTPGKETMIEKIKELSAEAIFVVRLEKIEGGEDQYLLPVWYHDWYDCYSRTVASISIPRYKDENYLVLLETFVYDARDERLIWLARSEVAMITCNCTEIIPFIKVIVDRLSADKLIR